MKTIIFIITACLSCSLAADEITDMYVNKAKKFVANNPVIENKVDAVGVVKMWLRVEGLNNLVTLLHGYRQEFERPGEGELRPFMVHKRLHSHQTKLPLVLDDDVVASLVELIKLHGYTGTALLDGRIDTGTYHAVASYVVAHGRVLAKQVEEKYADGKIIPD